MNDMIRVHDPAIGTQITVKSKQADVITEALQDCVDQILEQKHGEITEAEITSDEVRVPACGRRVHARTLR